MKTTIFKTKCKSEKKKSLPKNAILDPLKNLIKKNAIIDPLRSV